jgi:hypothetical protein
VLPADHVGVGGRHFYDGSGFVFGSPHAAIYRRELLAATMTRWNVGLGSAGPELDEETRAQLSAAGHNYVVYDTGKIVNILFQLDGNTLLHHDHRALLHIGGLSHFLSPPGEEAGERAEPSWARFEGMQPRADIARYTAAVVRAEIEERPLPEVPADADPTTRPRLERVRNEIAPLVQRYREW